MTCLLILSTDLSLIGQMNKCEQWIWRAKKDVQHINISFFSKISPSLLFSLPTVCLKVKVTIKKDKDAQVY